MLICKAVDYENASVVFSSENNDLSSHPLLPFVSYEKERNRAITIKKNDKLGKLICLLCS